MKRKRLNGSLCPVARSLDIVGDWWSLLLIRDAYAGARRFSEFQRSLDIAKDILTVRLRNLVEQGVMEITPSADGGAYLEYQLTPKGQALLPVLVALWQWGDEFLFDSDEQRSVVVDVRKGRPLRKLELRSEDGRMLAPKDISVTVTP